MLDDLPWGVWAKNYQVEGNYRKDLAMTEPEVTVQDAEHAPEPSTDEATADVNQEAGGEEGVGAEHQEAGEEEGKGADYQEKAKEAVTEDYQARMEKFDDVEASVPTTSLPVKTRDLDKSDLEI
jgi:hypothetical protein